MADSCLFSLSCCHKSGNLDDSCFHTSTADRPNAAAISVYQHFGSQPLWCGTMSGNDRCHYLLFRIRFLSSQRTHNFFGISISPFLPVLYFNNLCNNCHSDLCRCLRSDIQTDRCIHCIQHLLIHAFFRQTLFYQCCSSAASDHTDIGMLFCGYFLQTDLVIPVSSRQDHKIRIRTSRYLVQCFFEWFADNL